MSGIISVTISACFGFFGLKTASVIFAIISGALSISSLAINIKIHNLSKPRKIGTEKENKIIKKLSNNKGDIDIIRSGAFDEIQIFSNDIAKIFKKSGWNVTMSDGPLQISDTGLRMAAFNYKIYCTKALAIKDAFESSGVNIDCIHDKSCGDTINSIALYVTKKAEQ